MSEPPTYEQLVQDKIILRRAAGAVLDAADSRASAQALIAALWRLRIAMDQTNDAASSSERAAARRVWDEWRRELQKPPILDFDAKSPPEAGSNATG